MTFEKKPLLEVISKDMPITVRGVENYQVGDPSIIVANHTCMRDIFLASSAIPEASQIVLSSRLMWKRNNFENALRRLTIENALYGIPLEVHNGPDKLQVGLDMAKQALLEGWSVIIFPEGAYTGDRRVTRGRTGATRILFETRQAGVRANLIPLAIDTSPQSDDLDNFMPGGSPSEIIIGAPIGWDDEYESFINSDDLAEKRTALRAPIDVAMKSIALSAGLPYVDEYIELRPRSTIILENGDEVPLGSVA